MCVCVFPLILSFQKIDSPICWYSVLSGIRCCCWTASHSQDDDQVGWTVSNSVRQWNCSRQTQTVSSACWHFSSFSSSVIPRLQCCKTLCSDCPKSCRVRMQIYFSAFNFGESKLHHSNTRVISVKNWRILLVQSFTARMPLLTATSAFRLGRDAGVYLNSSTVLSTLAPFRITMPADWKNCTFHHAVQGITLPGKFLAGSWQACSQYRCMSCCFGSLGKSMYDFRVNWVNHYYQEMYIDKFLN